ncbi:alpha/beta hydrolase [Magnetospira sp. QH-2]|uniref:alpha/beta hydrolase n=1 Tax=Magnetospira sp. (strain QH-2) TaxID=1288970 RepID=UPI0003E815A2|nr:alpha/beta hydrolase [Magnetospira sp. QH-2]CCQ72181.1 arylformamidase [Magnetospira sp. QH-2]
MAIDPVQERLYNVRAAVPDHPRVFAEWKARSRDFIQASPAARLDLAYGEGPSETLDWFPADNPGGPVMMFIHGGYWQALDKADNAFVAEALVSAGVHVAVVNYALTPIVSLECIVDQMRRALLWLRVNGADLGADDDRLYVSGHSAGGHLTAMMMAESLPIRGGLAISGLFDLDPLVATSINNKVGLDQKAAWALSPVHRRKAIDAPLLLAVGGAESDGFRWQIDALRSAWGDMETLTVPGANHFGAVEALADPDSALFAATMRLIK